MGGGIVVGMGGVMRGGTVVGLKKQRGDRGNVKWGVLLVDEGGRH